MITEGGITAERDLLLVLDNCIIIVNEPCITIDLCILRSVYISFCNQHDCCPEPKQRRPSARATAGHRADPDRALTTDTFRRPTPTTEPRLYPPPFAATTIVIELKSDSFRCRRGPYIVHFQSCFRGYFPDAEYTCGLYRSHLART